jgi:peptidoglycan/LPS O-acetylase OafA/YrhL
MSMDWLLWVIRAVIIVAGIIVAIMVWKRKKGYSFRFLTIGTTALILGVILLIISLVADLSFFYGLYLIAVGGIGIIIGLVIRNTWEKNR